MPRVLTIAGMAIAALLFLMFGLDLALKLPFGRASFAMDLAFLNCAAILGYMSWNTYRELV